MAFPVGAAMSAGSTAAAGGGFPFAAALPIAGKIAGLFGGKSSFKAADAFTANYNMQKEFAKHGLRWRVEDAKRAGIHPLYALGGSGATYTPSAISVGGGGSSVGSSLAGIGQDVGRAIQATRTKPERFQLAMESLQVERGELENALLRSRIARENQVGPAFPSATGAPTSLLPDGVNVTAADNVAVEPGRRSARAGGNPETGFATTPTGYAPVPAQEAYEDPDVSNPAGLFWAMRNLILPMFDPMGKKATRPPDRLLPRGHVWRFSRSRGEWYAFNPGPSARDRWGR